MLVKATIVKLWRRVLLGMIVMLVMGIWVVSLMWSVVIWMRLMVIILLGILPSVLLRILPSIIVTLNLIIGAVRSVFVNMSLKDIPYSFLSYKLWSLIFLCILWILVLFFYRVSLQFRLVSLFFFVLFWCFLSSVVFAFILFFVGNLLLFLVFFLIWNFKILKIIWPLILLFSVRWKIQFCLRVLKSGHVRTLFHRLLFHKILLLWLVELLFFCLFFRGFRLDIFGLIFWFSWKAFTELLHETLWYRLCLDLNFMGGFLLLFLRIRAFAHLDLLLWIRSVQNSGRTCHFFRLLAVVIGLSCVWRLWCVFFFFSFWLIFLIIVRDV